MRRSTRIELVPRVGAAARAITGHIDFLQVRNGCVHVLDYKPDARTLDVKRGDRVLFCGSKKLIMSVCGQRSLKSMCKLQRNRGVGHGSHQRVTDPQ